MVDMAWSNGKTFLTVQHASQARDSPQNLSLPEENFSSTQSTAAAECLLKLNE